MRLTCGHGADNYKMGKLPDRDPARDDDGESPATSGAEARICDSGHSDTRSHPASLQQLADMVEDNRSSQSRKENMGASFPGSQVSLSDQLLAHDAQDEEVHISSDAASTDSTLLNSFVHDEPSGAMTSWRRVEKRTSSAVHFMLTDLVDFLAGREISFTESGLFGLTGPGTHGVREGDDLVLLEDMTFPVVARLEPSETLGNPKKRRRDMATAGMKREIVGTAVINLFDGVNGNLTKAVLLPDFEPLSGPEPGLLRFK
ncbi:hypothetical protein FZEAL_7987 [Fusarium zealandicum]|uniref:Uncharacterized protein n=1 Tax=Fusarium zealandicum TaxID=1053134 RepID=A0A8H4UEQ9_9HYPO|nr:hypothetical protein FZEAL_7987 [Fusarium zealandicum]